MTLDPCPDLTAARQDLARRDPLAETWKAVGTAMATAMRSISRELGIRR